MKKIISILLALSMAVSMSACSQSSSDTSSSDASSSDTSSSDTTESEIDPDGIVVIGLSAEPETLCPYLYTSDKDSVVQHQLFDTLFTADEEGVVVGDFVEEYSISEDGLTYTWKIHEGATWSDGEVLDIDDVIFTLNALANPEYAGGVSDRVADIVGYEEVQAGEATEMSGITRIDDYTLTIELKEVSNSFLVNFADDGPVLPEHILGDVSPADWGLTDFATNPVTYGAYTLVEWVPGQYISLERNEDYWGEVSNGGAILVFAEDSTSLVTSYTAGEIDMFEVPFEDVETVASYDYSVTYAGSSASYPLYPNLWGEHLGILEVRQAILYSYDAYTIAETVFGEYGTGFESIFGTSSWAISDDGATYEKDIDKAKELLESVGYTMNSDGYYEIDGSVLEIDVLNTGGDMEDVLVLWQASLKEAGIKVNISVVDWSVMVETITDDDGDNYDLYSFGGDGIDPSSKSVLFTTSGLSPNGFNFNHCSFEELDALWEAGAIETDFDTRVEIYQEIDEYMRENAIVFPMFSKTDVWVATDSIGNIVINDASNLKYLRDFTVAA